MSLVFRIWLKFVEGLDRDLIGAQLFSLIASGLLEGLVFSPGLALDFTIWICLSGAIVDGISVFDNDLIAWARCMKNDLGTPLINTV